MTDEIKVGDLVQYVHDNSRNHRLNRHDYYRVFSVHDDGKVFLESGPFLMGVVPIEHVRKIKEK